jgi:hypothetical protein
MCVQPRSGYGLAWWDELMCLSIPRYICHFMLSTIFLLLYFVQDMLVLIN